MFSWLVNRLAGWGLPWDQGYLLLGPSLSIQAKKCLGFFLARGFLPLLLLLFYSTRKPEPDASLLPPPRPPSTWDRHVIFTAAL